MKKIILLMVLVLFAITILPNISFAQEDIEYYEPVTTSNKITGTVDMNYTYDSRDMNRLTLNTLLFLPYGFTYYNVFHFNSLMAVDGGNFDIDNFYHEQDLWWNPYKPLPLDAVVQWQVNQGNNNDLFRLGFRWRISDTPWIKYYCDKIHLFLTTQVHALQTDFDPSAGWGFSFEHYWRMQIWPERFNDRVYMAGFMDHNVDYGGATNGNNHAMVIENQLGVRVYGNWNAIVEYRYSSYDVKHHGVAMGAEYVVSF